MNKMDVEGAEEKLEAFKEDLRNYENNVADKIEEEFRPSQLLKIDEVVPITSKFGAKSSVIVLRDSLRHWLDFYDRKKNWSKCDSVALLEDKVMRDNTERGPLLI